jgi:hypothetical protein
LVSLFFVKGGKGFFAASTQMKKAPPARFWQEALDVL